MVGDCLKILKEIPTGSVACCVSSPPYWGLRDYQMAGQIGLEQTLDEYLVNLSVVFGEVHRVLKKDGLLWLNMGDTYTSGNRKYRAADKKNTARSMKNRPATPIGLKRKDLIGLPWRLAFRLQQDGWYLRSDIVWHKPTAMPESVQDRPSRNHEYVFIMSKSERYAFNRRALIGQDKKLLRSVWSIPNNGNDACHGASFPVNLVLPCIRTCTDIGDVVLDPFFGSGTVGVAAELLNRRFIGIELNPDYAELAIGRLKKKFVLVEYEALVPAGSVRSLLSHSNKASKRKKQ